jgi:16S rRNA (cytosine967-C5)-methyltransferase
MPISPARAVAFDILLRVDQQNAYASELLHSERLEKLTPADRGLAMELVMGVLRWRSRLDDAIAVAASRPLEKLDAEVLNALRLAAYQLLFLTRVPAHAAINESVELVKRAQKRSAAPFANAVLRKIAETRTAPVQPSADEAPASSLAREYAHPVWMVERWLAQFGEEYARQICEFDQRVPPTSLRLENADTEQELASEGVKLAPGTLLASSRTLLEGDLTRTRAYLEGRVFIQDEASQLVAALVGTGSRLLDCCAAPGGKTAAIAWRNPTAEIIAAEIHEHRTALLRKRVRATNVEVITADALQLPLSGGFDRVLADVPCSGTGTLARNPDIKWRLMAENLSDLHTKQVAILRAVLQQLAPAGRAVYSTCSLEREENEAVIEEILRDGHEYRLRDCREELERLRASGELAWNDLDSLLSGPFLRTIPGVQPCDGFFAAVLERRRPSSSSHH